MKERNIVVCYDDHKCLGWRTQEELDKLLEEKRVDYFTKDLEITYVNFKPKKIIAQNF